jgi:hypothetical protein
MTKRLTRRGLLAAAAPIAAAPIVGRLAFGDGARAAAHDHASHGSQSELTAEHAGMTHAAMIGDADHRGVRHPRVLGRQLALRSV